MRKKPKGKKYRNLYHVGDAIYYQRAIDGKRTRHSTGTSDWNGAAAWRDLYEDGMGVGQFPSVLWRVPTFADFAPRYFEEETHHLSATTRRDRRSYLREDGPLLRFFGDRPLDAISVPLLREWWNAEIIGRGLSEGTGRRYLDVISCILAYAKVFNLVPEDQDPVTLFRQTLRRHNRTKRGRVEAQPDRNIHPIEDPADLAMLVAAAGSEGPVPLAFVLLCLDAGLRVGEALGLQWGRVTWGWDVTDLSRPERRLDIDKNRPRGGAETEPKSGRARKVALSLRLRDALARVYRERFEPGPGGVVLEGVEPANFRQREWRRIVKSADIGPYNLKDLRSTFASQLITSGVGLPYVSKQLGHAQLQTTDRHYTRWCAEGDEYREPWRGKPGEVPADLLASLKIAPSIAPTGLNPTGQPKRKDSLLRGLTSDSPRASDP